MKSLRGSGRRIAKGIVVGGIPVAALATGLGLTLGGCVAPAELTGKITAADSCDVKLSANNHVDDHITMIADSLGCNSPAGLPHQLCMWLVRANGVESPYSRKCVVAKTSADLSRMDIYAHDWEDQSVVSVMASYSWQGSSWAGGTRTVTTNLGVIQTR